MPKYLVEVSYSTDGVRGLMKEGGSSRVEMVDKMMANLGGRLESMHFAFGSGDAYVIAELPENSDMAALAMTVGATGAASLKTTVLMSPEEVDAASQKSVDYRAPGA